MKARFFVQYASSGGMGAEDLCHVVDASTEPGVIVRESLPRSMAVRERDWLVQNAAKAEQHAGDAR